MRSKLSTATAAILSAPGLGVVAVAVATTLALPASASDLLVEPAGSTTLSHASPAQPAPKELCYSQLDDDNGTGVVSQNFEESYDIYNAQGADDFTLTKKCRIKVIYVDGTYLNGPGSCRSFDVTFYRDGAGTPAAIIGFGDSDRDGGEKKRHVKIVAKKPLPLPKGTYWISVACNMDFATGGEFVWDTNNTVRGYASQWQNPADGLGTGCTTYTATTTCLPEGEGGDFSFAIGK